MKGKRLNGLLGIACGLGTALWGLPAAAQPAGEAGTQPATNGGEASISAPRAARELTRAAALDLQATGGMNPRDFRVAAMLLDVAHELAPKDEEILRLLIDAMGSAGDRERMHTLTWELMQLDPRDTVAQLRYLAGTASAMQSAEDRLDFYDKMLNFKGSTNGAPLDAAVRSRLALDAALLLRERGNIRGFADKLALATELDSTNKDAASLAVTFYSGQLQDHAGRLALLINLLLADPFDSETHLAIARELAAGEAVTQATRFYRTYEMLLRIRGREMPLAVAAETNVVFWESDNAMSLVQRMREKIESERSAMTQRQRIQILQDVARSQIMDPERVRLSPELERVRVAAALATGDQGQIDYAYGELRRTFELQLEAAKDKRNIPQGVKDADLQDRVLRLQGELMWMRLWAGKQLDEAQASLQEFKNDPTIDAPEVIARLEGWLNLQRGSLDEAERLLAPQAGSDVLARLGLCVLREKRGQKAEAISGYGALAHEAAGSVVGAFARTRYGVLAGKALERSKESVELDAQAAGVRGWLEEMIVDPRKILSLQASAEPKVITAMDPLRVRLRLRNVAPIPLGFGPERPINSRLLMVPKLDVALEWVRANTGAVVVRLDRRLRLLPQEEIDVAVWGDPGNMGWLLNRLVTAPLTVKWKVIQGFTLHPQGYYIPGPQCVSVETGYLQRRGSRKSYDEPAALLKWLETGTSEDVAEVLVLAQLNAQVGEEVAGVWTKEEKAIVSEAIADRYKKLDAPSRAMVAAMLPLPQQAPWLKAAEDAIAEDKDPLVRTIALALRVTDANDPRMAAAEASGDARLAEMSGLVRSRLADGTKTYATAGAKLTEINAGTGSGTSTAVPAPGSK